MKGLGSTISAALSSVNVTPERVEEWVGAPCGCKERQEKLDALGRWAARVARGKVDGAMGFLRAVMGEG